MEKSFVDKEALSALLAQFGAVQREEGESEGDEGSSAETPPDTNRNVDRELLAMFEQFQEEPELLDAELEFIVTSIAEHARPSNRSALPSSEELLDENFIVNRAFRLLYTLCKVRGYKTVVRFFPHEVRDLEPTLDYLLAQDPTHSSTWPTRYGLLLWLSIIGLIPFALSTVDSQNIDSEAGVASSKKSGIASRLIDVAKSFLSDSAVTRDAAAVLLARLFSRSDVQREHLDSFLQWSVQRLSEPVDDQDNLFVTMGIFSSLAHVFKICQRDILLEKLPQIFSSVISICEKSSSTLHRKLSMKLVQRIGLTCLKPREQSWTYQKGTRKMFASSESKLSGVSTATAADGHSDEDIDVPEEIESVIQQLLNGLKDRDTVVRWSAAKGLGRISARLPSDFADEVVGSVLALLNPHESEASWHGGCLCIAELSRRGVLLPSRLPDTMSVVLSALSYDVVKGTHSVGANVRDAACYVCWAFARAYAPEVMQPHVKTLASGLLLVAVFDREVNCRRAACAAFQENVGRQGNFPHGIAINTIADYFSVGNRINAFTRISKEVARFEDYRQSFIDHLVEVKLSHWDKTLRELSADAIYELAELDPGYMIETVLPILLPRTLSSQLNERHGAALAIAKVIVKLSEVGAALGADLEKKIRNIVMKVEKARLFRGRGGMYMRVAVCKVIEAIARSHMVLQGRTVVRLSQSIDENLRVSHDEVQKAAVDAQHAFTAEYHAVADTSHFALNAETYIKEVRTSANAAVTRGFCLALGALPREVLRPRLTEVVDCLVRATEIQENTDDQDPETRRNALKALRSIALTLAPTGEELFRELKTPPLVVDGSSQVGGGESSPKLSGDDGGMAGSKSNLLFQTPPRYSTFVPISHNTPTPQPPTQSLEAQQNESPSKLDAASDGDACDKSSSHPDTSSSLTPAPQKEPKDSKDAHWATSQQRLLVFDAIFLAFLRGAEDYSCDSRGDVGSWSRGAAIDGLDALSNILSTLSEKKSENSDRIDVRDLSVDSFIAATVGVLIKQLTEKLNKVRQHAGETLHRLLSAHRQRYPVASESVCDSTRESGTQHIVELCLVIPQSLEVDWSNPAETFPLLVPLLRFDAFRAPLLAGLVVTTGGLTESLVRHSSKAFLEFMTPPQVSDSSIRSSSESEEKSGDGAQTSVDARLQEIRSVAWELLNLLESHSTNSRYVVCVFKTLSLLFSNSVFDILQEHKDRASSSSKEFVHADFFSRLSSIVRSQIRKTSDVPKLFGAIDVLVGMLPFDSEQRSLVVAPLLRLLSYRYPKVRATTAERFYAALMVRDDLIPDEELLDEVCDLLSTTAWTSRLASIEEPISRMYKLFNVSQPKRKPKSKSSAAQKTAKEPTFSDFIRDMQLRR